MYPSNGPAAITNLRVRTLADRNRGQLRAVVWASAVVFAVMTFLAWPDLPIVLVGLAATGGMFLLAIWLHFALPSLEGGSEIEQSDTRDSATGERD